MLYLFIIFLIFYLCKFRLIYSLFYSLKPLFRYSIDLLFLSQLLYRQIHPWYSLDGDFICLIIDCSRLYHRFNMIFLCKSPCLQLWPLRNLCIPFLLRDNFLLRKRKYVFFLLKILFPREKIFVRIRQFDGIYSKAVFS